MYFHENYSQIQLGVEEKNLKKINFFKCKSHLQG